MQANGQTFFLGVMDLSPGYTEAPATGGVVVGYDKAKTSLVQVKGLVDILKKEKMRWHSDRLRRRNKEVWQARTRRCRAMRRQEQSFTLSVG